ncbi:MAG: glycosyltransferase involved in cell wall biosynthesis [Rhodothermales bacterium]
MTLLFYLDHCCYAQRPEESFAIEVCRALAKRDHDVHVLAKVAEQVPGLVVHEGWDNQDQVKLDVWPDLSIDWGLKMSADVHRIAEGLHAERLRQGLDAYHGLGRIAKRLDNLAFTQRRRVSEELDILHHTEGTFLVSSFAMRDQTARCGGDADRIEVLFDGVDTWRFRANVEHRAATRARWGVGEDEIVFLCAPLNHRLDNVALLQRIFRGFVKTAPRARLVIMGEQASGRNVIAGGRAQMETIYPGADVLLHPAAYDPFASQVLEAMSCGVPVICSNRCGADAMVEVDCGQVVPVDGPLDAVEKQWRQAITRMFDGSLRANLSVGAREAALPHAFDAFIDRLEDTLKRIYAKRPQRRRSRTATASCDAE